jgi:hypothetical protein
MHSSLTVVPLVGLDIGKNVHMVGSYRSDTLEALHEPFHLYNTRQGFERLVYHLNELLRQYPAVQLAMNRRGFIMRHLGGRFKNGLSKH